MPRPSDLKLVRRMMEKGLHDEALEIVRLLEKIEDEEPLHKAHEFELDFLIRHIKRAGVPVQPTKFEKNPRAEEDDQPEQVPVQWSEVPMSVFAELDEHEKRFVVPGNPRIASLLAGGPLPSLQAYREGRRP